MKPKFVASFLAFSILVSPMAALATSDAAQTPDTRYFIASTKSFWKTSLNARNVFEDGFTADLSPLQLRVAKFAGLKPVAVKRLTILPSDTEVSASGRKPTGSTRPLPSAQVSWGVQMMYGDTTVTPSGGASVSVAILDSGITKDHPDLKRRIQDCRDFTQAKAPMVEGVCDDKNGHGTHVAGIIAADGGEDSKGIYGMAPQASLKAFKVCGANGSCWSDDIAMAIRVAADTGANIINMSLGSDTVSSLISDAVSYAASKDVLVVAAAGNDGPYLDSIDYPGALVDVVAVGAVDKNKTVADFSSRGINSTTEKYVINERDIEVAAPGVNVESTYPTGYAVMSGTSMASPHVAGFAALIWQKDVTSHHADATRSKLHALTHDIDAVGDDDASGWGLPTL